MKQSHLSVCENVAEVLCPILGAPEQEDMDMDFVKLSLMETTKLVREFHTRHAKKHLVCSAI